MRFVLFGIFSALCAAQTREMGPKQILTKLGETYRNLKSFNFEVSQHSSANVRGVDFGSVNFDYAGVRPDKSYLYQKGPATDLVCQRRRNGVDLPPEAKAVHETFGRGGGRR